MDQSGVPQHLALTPATCSEPFQTRPPHRTRLTSWGVPGSEGSLPRPASPARSSARASCLHVGTALVARSQTPPSPHRASARSPHDQAGGPDSTSGTWRQRTYHDRPAGHGSWAVRLHSSPDYGFSGSAHATTSKTTSLRSPYLIGRKRRIPSTVSSVVDRSGNSLGTRRRSETET